MSSTERGHESYELKPGPIAVAGLLLSLVIALAFWAMGDLSDSFEAQAERDAAPNHPLATVREVPPAPRLQARPNLEVEAHRRAMNTQAGEYRWIDAEAGVVRIPLQRALDLTAERGLPVFEAEEQGQ